MFHDEPRWGIPLFTTAATGNMLAAREAMTRGTPEISRPQSSMPMPSVAACQGQGHHQRLLGWQSLTAVPGV